MDARKLFSDIPEDLAALSDDDIQGLLATHMDAIDKIAAEDPEFLGDLDAVSVLSEMESGVEDVERIKAELSAREGAAEAFRAKKDELAARVKPAELAAETEEPEAVEETEQTDDPEAAEIVAEAEAVTEAAAELEPIVAAAPRVRRPLPRPSAAHQAVESTPNGFVASSGIPDVPAGHVFQDGKDYARAAIRAHKSVSQLPPGFRQDVVIASLNVPYPEDRRLAGTDADPDGFANMDTIKRYTSPQALTASGGLCAPVTPYYEQQFIATLDRPVRDALAGFNANRGGIRFNPPVGIGTVTGSDAIGIITAAEDAEGGTFATKSCLTVACVDAVEVDVDIIYHCVVWSNLTSRTFPERVAQFNETVLAGHARLAETNLLNKIKAGSTNVTQANTNSQGATSSLLGSVLTAAAGYRSRQRMNPDAPLRAILPAWTRDLLVADIVRSQFNRFDMTESGLMALLKSYNINASFSIDGPSTGTGQVFGAQTAGALDPFPTSVQWALFSEGSWLFLDDGVLELGIVRDSVLNATNMFSQFGESFESAAFVGIESLWITTAVCPSGTVAAPVSNANFCA